MSLAENFVKTPKDSQSSCRTLAGARNMPERRLGKKEKEEVLLNRGKRNPAALIKNSSTRDDRSN
jgi:hypothetical protein